MEIKGQVEEIIYQNEVNSYTVADFNVDGELITAVGYLPFIVEGDCLKLIGRIVNHPDYGEQLKIDTFEKIMPETIEALEKYLAGGIIKGVGPVLAKRIVNSFREDTISVLKFEPDRLSGVKGITLSKAEEISEEFNQKWELWQVVGFLEKFGISGANSKKVYEKLGPDARSKIEENPYILLDITYGVDFKKIDKMAMDLGLSDINDERIKSGIKYSLVLASYNGNTCVVKENLISFVKDLLDVEEEYIEEQLINLKAKQEIFIEKQEKTNWVYLDTFFKCEQNIADKIVALNKSKNIKEIKNLDKELEKIEKKEDIKLSKEQKDAIYAVNDNNVCVITGGPGTGKTTIIKFIIELFKLKGKKVVLCAPTGRAAKRMQEATGEDASTIHGLLAIWKIDDDTKYINIDADVKPIDADVVIIDEMSMVDSIVMNYILNATYIGTKLILVGDVNQLPSVGPGNVLGDIIDSKKVNVIELNKIFRQAAKSKIIVNAHRVNNGESFLNSNDDEKLDVDDEEKLKDFFFINETTQEKCLADVISLCTGRLKEYGDYDFFKNIQVLSPTKKGMLGTRELNKELQKVLNPQNENEKRHGERIFRPGDRIMQVKNNYDIFWEKKDEKSGKIEHGSGIFNGELGRVIEIDEDDRILKVRFDDDKEAWYDYTELEELEHSYSITIHKSQR